MDDHTTDDQLRRFSAAVVHISPEPPPIIETEKRRVSRRPLIAAATAFVVVFVVFGAIPLVSMVNRSNDSVSGTEVQSDFDEYWTWLTTDSVQLDGGAVGVTQRGPTPSFDTTTLGEVQRIVTQTEVPIGTARFAIEAEPPVAYIGTLDDTNVQITVARPVNQTDGDIAMCLHNSDPNHSYGGCTGNIDPAEGQLMWLSIEGGGPDPTRPSRVVAVAMLPRDTAAVVLTLPNGQVFVEQPNGGVVAFYGLPIGGPFIGTLEALDADGTMLLTQAASP